MIANRDELDIQVFRRYAGVSLPRHVSYPMPSWWSDVDCGEAAAMRLESDQQTPPHDLSLYLHVPFCEHLCRYCACTRVVQRKDAPASQKRVQNYIGAMEAEIRRLGDDVNKARRLRQIHWGGGSPTYLNVEQIERIQRAINEVFSVSDDAEIAMEVDPRGAAPDLLRGLRRLGFNRMSLGVQDFDPRVQEHVRRVQPFELVRDTVATCRDLGFQSVNFDLIYGMPYQTPETIRRTVEQTIELSPDRVAYYHYAQIPEKIANQRGMDYTKLPDSETKLEMFLIGLRLFEPAGYEFIGLDHFARPDERLAVARKNGGLQRNFQGMTTGGGLDLLGVGASSISHLLDVGFLQNIKGVDHYVTCMQNGDEPVERGKRFTLDDRIRQTVVNQLYCYAETRPVEIEERFGIVFADYFARELGVAESLQDDGLLNVDGDGVIRVTMPLGRVLMRTVAAVFDAYLDPEAYRYGEQGCFSQNA